jgi:ABC-type Fe3+-hydroxamate transport system substrate-binding protein
MRSGWVAALAAIAALAGCGGSSASFPEHPARLVTEDQLSTDVMVALGFHPAGAVGMTAGSWAPALARYLAGTENVGASAGGSANLDAVTGIDPDGIVAPVSLQRSGWSKNLQRVAPTVLYTSTRGWRGALDSLAEKVGRGRRAQAVVAKLDARAAAIRGLVGGRSVALLHVVGPQSFSTVNDEMPVARVLIGDLGLRNAHLRPQQYPYGCAAKPCVTNSLFAPILTMMTPPEAVLVESPPGASAVTAAFEKSAPFRLLAAVRAGRVSQASTYEELGPLGVGFLYAAVARAFGVQELHGRDAPVAVAYEPSTGRVCAAGESRRLVCSRVGALPAAIRLDGRRVSIAPGPLQA